MVSVSLLDSAALEATLGSADLGVCLYVFILQTSEVHGSPSERIPVLKALLVWCRQQAPAGH